MMKPVLRKIGFWIGIFLQTLIIAGIFLIGWGMSFTAIDLNKAAKTTGTIVSARPEQSRQSKTVSGFKPLIIRLDNDGTGYWLYRASQNYSGIIAALPLGSRVTIYRSNVPDADGYTAYQVNNSQGIIYSISEYEDKEKLAGRFIALPGAFILLGAVIFQIRKRYKPSRQQS
ncbi:hypothetical protein [Mucilaginibacter gotjawali]|uniref:DUF3592 domain-containing protein n=2 Tax=Mucilaginibacter gotjawali TaxID=1550579 RepID=A0A839SI22_9SPHI|nr:hypothetical protein [Mucilaginibacter gotjawali]MBB3057905.1 hypothetical protein [Mucilaginibacter gotjawali]